MLILAPLDLNGNEIRGLRLEVLAADPSGGGLYEGRIWFNSTTNLLKYYDGVGIVPLSAAVAGITSFAVDNATIENIGTSSDPDIKVKNAGIGATQLGASISLTKFVAPTADYGFGGFKITNLADPSSAQDAATRAYVLAQIAALVDSSPGTLDTLNELAAALGDDANFAATTATALGALDTRLDALEAAPALTRKYAVAIGNASATTITVTHNLGTRDVVVSIYDASTYAEVQADVVNATTNTVTVTFAVAPGTNAYRAVVVG